MKRKWIFILIAVALLLFFVSGYKVIEYKGTLPTAPGAQAMRIFGSGTALAEAEDTNDLNKTAENDASQAPVGDTSAEALAESTYSLGSTGEEVKTLQTRLKVLGFLTGSADGQFGPKTEQAVKDLKKYLDDRAQADAKAKARAEELLWLREQAAYGDAPVLAIAAPERANTIHGIGALDETWQAQLLTMGEIPDIDVAAPVQLPAQEVLPEPEVVYTGEVDEPLYAWLTGDGFAVYRESLQQGGSGLEVVRLQRRLVDLGYLSGNADGAFGGATRQALEAFQSRNKLAADGVAGEATQKLLYSPDALKQVKPNKPYVLKVSTSNQRVYAYAWNEQDLAYTTLIRTMVCSTGKTNTPTPKGTYKSATPVARWGYFPKFDVWAQYLYRISGPYLFHSVLYSEANEKTLLYGSQANLGSKASHGCVRLSVADAKWIYNNCPANTTVTVY